MVEIGYFFLVFLDLIK